MNTKRFLSIEEIEDILQVIQPLNNKSPDWLNQDVFNAQQTLLLQLNKIQLYPAVIPKFKEHIKQQYFKSILQPGEMVGVIAASSIGEQNTQASLNR